MTLKCLCTQFETFSSLAFEAMLTELLVQTIEKMYQLYQEHFKIYSFNQLIVGKYNTALFSSIYGENNVCSALVVAKCIHTCILDILSFRMWLDDLSVSEFKFGLANPHHQGHPHPRIKWFALFAPDSPLTHHFSPLNPIKVGVMSKSPSLVIFPTEPCNASFK